MKINVYKGLHSTGWGPIDTEWKIIKQSPSREWLDDTGTVETNSAGYGNKCLPLKIGNQLGWAVLFPTDVTCYYDTKNSSLKARKTLNVKVADKKYDLYFKSHFGSGILTCAIPLIFQTKRNRQLYVRGPTNHHKDGVMYMDAVVETDWMNFKFTYNMRIVKNDTHICFKKGEPMFSFIPINLQEIDQCYVQESSIYKKPLLGFLASLYSEKRLNLINTHSRQYWTGSDIAMLNKTKKEKELAETDEQFAHNLKDHYWMKDYFLGGWDGVKKRNNVPAPKDLLGPEIGCPYLHFLSLKREKHHFNIKELMFRPFRIIRFYLFRNVLFYKLYFKRKILKNNFLTKRCLFIIKHNFPKKWYNKFVGSFDKKLDFMQKD